MVEIEHLIIIPKDIFKGESSKIFSETFNLPQFQNL